jgi:hypothetical protein
MVKRLRTLWIHAGLWLVLAGLPLCAAPAGQAQGSAAFPTEQSRAGKERTHPERLPEKPTLPPVFTIPVDPLGFSAPGAIYLGQRNSLASLDFLDENRLLFTFRVPGLMRREAGDSAWGDERQIRAVVLALPAGTVESEALWTVHDRSRYLWALKDGHFLLRDRDSLEQGDATLELKPFLRFPGPLLGLEMDPTQQFLVTNSREPAAHPSDQNPSPGTPAAHPSDQDPSPGTPGAAEQKPGQVGSPATAAVDMVVDERKSGGQPDLVVRILRRDSGEVMLVSRVRSTVHLPINSEGYLESLRGNGEQWLLNLNYFSGGSAVLGRVNSACSPGFDFVSQRELLVTACASSGGRKLVAMATDGRRLWEDQGSPAAIWPLVVMAPDGSRLAQETLAVTHAVNAYSPLESEDVKGQRVRVFDAANGKVALEAPATPALDAGGNVAISPSGRRVALLNAGAIQVFELPAPAPMEDAASEHAAH